MNIRTTQWMCHGCKRRGNAVSFVAELEGVSPLRASRWLREKYAPGFKEPETGSMEDEFDAAMSAVLEPVLEDRNPVLDEALIGTRFRRVDWSIALNPPVDWGWSKYWRGRRFTAETMRDAEMVWDPISERVCMTVRDEEGNLIGFKGRAHWPDAQPRYLVLGDRRGRNRYGFEPYRVSLVLYNLHRARWSCGPGVSLIVCEGELNALACVQAGLPNTVGISGSSLSEAQADLVVRYADHVVLVWDERDQGLVSAVELLEQRVRVSIVDEHNDDPAALDSERIHDLVRSARSSLVV